MSGLVPGTPGSRGSKRTYDAPVRARVVGCVALGGSLCLLFAAGAFLYSQVVPSAAAIAAQRWYLRQSGTHGIRVGSWNEWRTCAVVELSLPKGSGASVIVTKLGDRWKLARVSREAPGQSFDLMTCRIPKPVLGWPKGIRLDPVARIGDSGLDQCPLMRELSFAGMTTSGCQRQGRR